MEIISHTRLFIMMHINRVCDDPHLIYKANERPLKKALMAKKTKIREPPDISLPANPEIRPGSMPEEPELPEQPEIEPEQEPNEPPSAPEFPETE